MCVSLYFKSAFSSCVVSQNIVNKIHINIEVKSYLQQQVIWSIKFEEGDQIFVQTYFNVFCRVNNTEAEMSLEISVLFLKRLLFITFLWYPLHISRWYKILYITLLGMYEALLFQELFWGFYSCFYFMGTY